MRVTTANGSTPNLESVYVDEIPYTMSYASGSFPTGAIYRATLTLPVGNHRYYFVAADSSTRMVYPLVPKVLAGPNVAAAVAPAPPSVEFIDPIQSTSGVMNGEGDGTISE
jgi:hypothetical protein